MPDVLATLKSALTVLALPPTSLILALLVGAWWRASAAATQRRLGALAILAACATLWIVSTFGFAQWMNRAVLKVPEPLPVEQVRQLPRQDTAIVVLGGGLRPRAPEYGEADLLRNGLARLRYGAWLARQTGLPLGFCGGVPRNVPVGTPPEAAIAERILRQEYGLPLRWREERSRDTRENARFMAPLLQRDGVKRVLLVTHAWHMPRAMRAFRAALPPDVAVEAVAMGHIASQDAADAADLWWPSMEGLMQSRLALREWLGWLAGH